MTHILEMYRSQLLWGASFLSEYQRQLDKLYSDPQFMALIHEIQSQAPAEESDETIAEIKQIAKTTLFQERAAYSFPALREIVDRVASRGSAKNSALISVYCAMRIYELSGVMSEQQPVNASAMPSVPPDKVNSEADFRLKWPAEYRCEDGHYVRSKNEALVDNWLYYHNICHAYEKVVFSKDSHYTYCSDFFLPSYKLFIEIWGMNDEQYETRREQKVSFYKQNGYDLLQMFGDDIKNLDDHLSKALCVKGEH